jgi:hypothetical protein
MDTPNSRTYCPLQWKQTRIKSVHAQLRDLTNNKCRYSDYTVTKLIPNSSLLLLQLYIKIVLKSKNLLVLQQCVSMCVRGFFVATTIEFKGRTTTSKLKG